MNLTEIQDLKESATEKRNQGDVRIYLLPKAPKSKLEIVKDPVLVYGDSGNHHKLVGGSFGIKRDKESGVAIVTVKKVTKLTHEQHIPPHDLKPGTYLIDRAREKGVFDDMINPVAD